MSNAVLVIGPSGSGKSTALKNLDEKSTFIINVLDKPLPFKGYKKKYKRFSKENQTGNYFSSDNWQMIIKCIEKVNDTRPEITTLVIDDWQYILAYEFMRRTGEKGFDKFSELAMHGWATINACLKTRSNLTAFILSHSEVDNTGRSKCKTIGKMLDEKITIEGLFTTVLHSRVKDGKYGFQTQYTDEFLAKSPMGMFKEEFMPNDLQLVKDGIENYYNDDDEE